MATAVEPLPPEDFPLSADDPLHAAHRWLADRLAERPTRPDAAATAGELTALNDALAALDDPFRTDVLRAALRRSEALRPRRGRATAAAASVLSGIVFHLCRSRRGGAKPPPVPRENLAEVAAAFAHREFCGIVTAVPLSRWAVAAAKRDPLPDAVRRDLRTIARQLVRSLERPGRPPAGTEAAIARLRTACGDD